MHRRSQFDTNLAVARAACSALWELRAYGAPLGQCVSVAGRILREADEDTFALAVLVAQSSFREIKTAHRPLLLVWLMRRDGGERLRRQPDWLEHVLGALETLEEEEDQEHVPGVCAALAHLLYESEARDEQAVEFFARAAGSGECQSFRCAGCRGGPAGGFGRPAARAEGAVTAEGSSIGRPRPVESELSRSRAARAGSIPCAAARAYQPRASTGSAGTPSPRSHSTPSWCWAGP